MHTPYKPNKLIMERNFMKGRVMHLLLLSVILFSSNCKKETTPASLSQNDSDAKSLTGKIKLAALSSAEPLQTVANGTFVIVNKLSGKVLDVDGYKTTDGTTVWQYGATGGSNQKWTLKLRTGGYYSAIDNSSGKGLQVDDAGKSDGAITTIATYTGATKQQWQFVSLQNGYYKIVNRYSGKVLDVNGGSLDDLGKVQQWTSNNGDNQQWALLKPTYNGQLTWQLTTTNVPADAQARIKAAMNDACARFNAGANWPARTLTVEYNPDVPTADGSSGSSNIRFGADASYQTVRTAMHEIAHTYGVGQSGGWYSNTSTGDFLGSNTVATIHAFETPTSAIHTGGGHFWPYGLNYDDEWSETAAFRQVKLVYAMRTDGM
ncbi:ricin-type beta-trefoil lectin protein [Mucilaginibacter oryzae]|uniref:Ricin-type beta-trefoil lectin protein n=2 Tax=Mucilaginibacter oryzae TaxID=468058 RepID=A0A316H8C3_9SPHI|nr:ricin-type beta-trefoil lectin protein [Mucilaginibacter oryzae]